MERASLHSKGKRPVTTKRELLESLDAFTAAYIVTLLWTGAEYSADDAEGVDLRDTHDPADISLKDLREIIADCKDFREANAALIGDRDEEAGTDFALTRNRHGAGFWDGRWAEAGRTLTEAAHSYGSQNLGAFKGRKRLTLSS
jgi:hypothetical protein